MSSKKKFKTVDEYIESQPEDTRRTLLALRAIIMKAVPDATELFNYDIPAFALVKDGKRDKQIMIAGYKTFAGFDTGTGIVEQFSKELAGYMVGKAAAARFSNVIGFVCPSTGTRGRQSLAPAAEPLKCYTAARPGAIDWVGLSRANLTDYVAVVPPKNLRHHHVHLHGLTGPGIYAHAG